jgi:hypothetical protein
MTTKCLKHMMPVQLRIAVPYVGLPLLTSIGLYAQAINRVSGLVTDQSGAVVVGAVVSAQETATIDVRII